MTLGFDVVVLMKDTINEMSHVKSFTALTRQRI